MPASCLTSFGRSGRRTKLKDFMAHHIIASPVMADSDRQHLSRNQARMQQELNSLESRLQMIIEMDKERKNEEKRQAERERKERELLRKKVCCAVLHQVTQLPSLMPWPCMLARAGCG